MSDLELFPCHHTTGANLVRLNFEATVLKVKHVRLLSENSWKQSHYGPAEESTIRCSVAPVEKGIGFLAVTVDVTVDPYVSLLLLCYLFEESLNVENFRLEVLVRINPLPI